MEQEEEKNEEGEEEEEQEDGVYRGKTGVDIYVDMCENIFKTYFVVLFCFICCSVPVSSFMPTVDRFIINWEPVSFHNSNNCIWVKFPRKHILSNLSKT